MESYPIERFDPLLRDLAAYGLVVRKPTKMPSWQLTDAAQRRLGELVESKGGPVDPEKLIYFDRRCGLCRIDGPTRLREGIYVCDACIVHLEEEMRLGPLRIHAPAQPPRHPAGNQR